jgi:nucleotide-binding universal stress UspA family protein
MEPTNARETRGLRLDTTEGHPMTAILLATDGTDASQAATQYAIDLARARGASLHVLAVRPPAFFGSGGPAFVTRLEEVHAAGAVAREAAQAAAAVGIDAYAHAIEGDDASAIVRVATEVGVDMIVVGCRDEDASREGHAGSVSRAVSDSSPTDITVVRVEPRRVTG